MIASAPATVRVHHNLPARCARCSASCSSTVYEIGGALYGSRCAEIVLGAEVFASVSGRGGKGNGSAEEGADVMPPRPVRPRTIAAKFAGSCSCGRSFAPGAEIVYSPGEGVVGCVPCDLGRAPALPFPAGGRAAMDAAMAVVDNYASAKAARAKARRDLDRLLSWWCRLTPAQALAAE
jgi:hypothetical protein